ncbi:MAG: hypothetical protein IPK26_11790 [Planctomycetes bacterium]|nr:hypothetical protein [Planctomycetota bacterium]
MHRFSLLAVLATSSVALGQFSLPTLSQGGNNGNQGGGIYFDLEVINPITITQIDFLCGATIIQGGVTVPLPPGVGNFDLYMGPGSYLGNATNPAQWVLVTSSAPVATGASIMAQGVLNTPLGLAPGNYGIALKATSAFNWGYTNGGQCSSTTVPGSCLSPASMFADANLIFRGGAASNVFQTLPTFQPRIFNGTFHYQLGGTPTPVASWQAVGSGCYGRWSSFYEVFANPAGLDFGTGFTPGILMTLVPGENRYNVSVSNNPVVPPTGTPVTFPAVSSVISAAQALGGTAGGPFPSGNVVLHPAPGGLIAGAVDLQIATAGYISPQAAAITNDVSPTAAEVLSGPIRWMPHWKNTSPFGAVAPAGVYVEEDLANGQLRVTYQSIPDNAATSTFQVVYHYATGNVEYRYGAMSIGGGGSFPAIIGWTLGNAAANRGSQDLSAEMPFATGYPDNLPLTLTMGARPLINSNPVFTITAHELPQAVGGLLVGFSGSVAGAPLAGFGMPECFNYATLATSVTNLYVVSGGQGLINFFIPNSPMFIGVEIWSQAAALGSTFNSAFGVGANASNGVKMRIGNL